MTKWCPPENGVKTFENAEAAVELSMSRMKQDKISLLQCKLKHNGEDSRSINLQATGKIISGTTQMTHTCTTSAIYARSRSKARSASWA